MSDPVAALIIVALMTSPAWVPYLYFYVYKDHKKKPSRYGTRSHHHTERRK